MIKHNGAFYQPLCFHDGTYTNPLVIPPFRYVGGGRLVGLVLKTTGTGGGGQVRVRVNGTFVTSAISLPSGLPAGTARIFYFQPSHFSAGNFYEVKPTDVVEIVFTSNPTNLRVGVVLT